MMYTNLDDDWVGDLMLTVEFINLRLDFQCRRHSVFRCTENCHDRITNSFDNCALVVLNYFKHKVEVLPNHTVGFGVADQIINRGRFFQVAEKN